MLVSRRGSSDSLNDKRENKNHKNGTAFWGWVVRLFATSLRVYIYFFQRNQHVTRVKTVIFAHATHILFAEVFLVPWNPGSFKDFWFRILNQAINPLHSRHAFRSKSWISKSQLGEVGNLWDWEVPMDPYPCDDCIFTWHERLICMVFM